MKILIADDHEIVRRGLVSILNDYKPLAVIEEVSNGEEALKKVNDNHYDLFILDISMPGISGLEVLEKIKRENKEAKVLMLSIHPGKEYALHSFKLGASGYIAKDNATDELVLAIDAVNNGRKYITNDIAEKLLELQTEQTSLSPHELLSEQEYKVFIKLAEGKRVNDIAEVLFLSPKTISTYKKRILEKMNLDSTSELTKYALKFKLIE